MKLIKNKMLHPLYFITKTLADIEGKSMKETFLEMLSNAKEGGIFSRFTQEELIEFVDEYIK